MMINFHAGLYSRYTKEYKEHKQQQRALNQSQKLQKAIALNKCPNIKHFKQSTNKNCGPASIRMVLATLGIEQTEKEICDKIKKEPEFGTSLNKLLSIKEFYDLKCEYGNNGSIKHLTNLTNDGWICIVGYSLDDVSHYAVFLYDNNCGHIILNDPWFGAHFALKKNKFLKRWKIQRSAFPDFYPYRFDDPYIDTFRWYAAFKKNNQKHKHNGIHHRFDPLHHYLTDD